MEIGAEDFNKIVDVDIGIDVYLRRKTQTIDQDYGSLISDSYEDYSIKVIWEEVTGEEENFRPEGEFKIGDIKCYAKGFYNVNLMPVPKSDTIIKDSVEYKIVKSTVKRIGKTIIYRLLQLRLK
jgi:hypothetical protein